MVWKLFLLLSCINFSGSLFHVLNVKVISKYTRPWGYQKDFRLPNISIAYSESEIDEVLTMRRREGIRTGSIGKYTNGKEVQIVLAKRDEEIVGSCDIELHCPDKIVVKNLISERSHRYSGVATQLILESTNLYKEQGYKFMYLDVLVTNKPAIRLYKKLNFGILPTETTSEQKKSSVWKFIRKMLLTYIVEDNLSWIYHFQFPTPKVYMRKDL
jgi:ribosomal protein S18 acetylase RimI-like enzyme